MVISSIYFKFIYYFSMYALNFLSITPLVSHFLATYEELTGVKEILERLTLVSPPHPSVSHSTRPPVPGPASVGSCLNSFFLSTFSDHCLIVRLFSHYLTV